MKKISFMIAALLVAMTGCQKEPQVNPENNPGSNAEAVGYVSLKISLPSSTATRATDTDFSDGEANGNEYKVNDVTIVFYGEDGAYQETVTVEPDPIWNNNAADDITVSGKTPAIPVKNAVKQALVLVNASGLITKFDYPTYSAFNSALESTIAQVIGTDEAPDFFMSNEPYYKDGKFTTLVSVDVKPTATQALEAAKNVKVERAAAKVTVKFDNTKYVNAENESKAVVKGWNLDVTNKSFYPVRQGYDSNAANEWFTGADTPANQSIIGLSRIYWAKDPNYAEGNITGETLSAFNRVTEGDLTLGNNAFAYCLENTFNTNCMNENQTTTVMLKANYVPKDINEDETWFMVGPGKTVYSAAGLVEYIKSKLTAEQVATVPADLANTLSANAGEVEDVMVAERNSVMLNDLVGEVICYKDGICYYPVKVRHFTAEELGYADEAEFKNSFEGVGAMDPGYKTNDLGRYGVLRNTWYNITVNSIKNPGSPVIPDPIDNPDDKFEQFVACTIDILAWSVRNHGVDL